MTTEAPYPIPLPTLETAAFWEGCSRGELLVQKCVACGETRFFPRPRCPACTSPDFSWTKSTGKGKVYSWVVVHAPVAPAFQSRVPMPVAVVELDEGVFMVSELLHCRPDEPYIGMPVEVEFEEHQGMSLPKFRPAKNLG